jgi:endoglucanase Acf2
MSSPKRRRSIAAGAVLALVSGLLTVAITDTANAAVVGAGSYTETPPAGAALPSGCGALTTNPRQYVTANAPSGAVPTNDWWSSLLFKRTDCSYSEPLHAHPLAFDPSAGGLGVSYTTTPTISGTATGVGEYHYPYQQDLLVGVAGLNSPDVKVDGWSDWTVTPYWSDGARTLKATIGHGLPFSYYQVTGGNAQLTTAGTPSVWSNSGGVIGFTAGGSDYVAYAPSGATWAVSGTSITSSLGGRGYFSVAVLPTTSSTTTAAKAALASSYGTYAHAHVTGTRIAYTYSPNSNNALSTTYSFTTTAREGSATGTVVSLYPHQWKYLSGSTPIADSYVSARGAMKVLTGVSSFRTAMTFRGTLPEIPGVGNSGADLTTLNNYLAAAQANPEDNRGPDTYWTGKGLGRAARIAEIADQVGNTAVRNSALAAIKSRLTNWLTASSGESQSLFYYNANWGTLIGYPASYGSDQELNDHHFHYGYYIAAAATLARFEPAWAASGQYGGMIDLLIRDGNNYDRNDTRFPYLRDFDIYAGHDWASGHGSFGSGNNQESSSEGMNFANALIQWGQVTGNTAVRDAGVFIYTTQAAAIQEYWFDSSDTNFPAAFGHSTVGMVWGSGGAYATWFTADPEMIQGINMLPVTGGHLYLGYNPSYVTTNYNEMVRNNGGAPTVWQDILWEFLALGNPDQALANFRANNGFTSEEGESKAHTFHWLRNLSALGTVDTSVSANHPLTATFVKNGARTYVASNVSASPITVTFSTGTTLTVPAGKTATTGAWVWTGGSGGGGTQPTPSPTPTPTPTVPPGAATRYLIAGGGLNGTAAGAGSVAVSSAGGGNHDGTPHNPTTFTATGVTNTYNGGSTAFDLYVDAGTSVGLASQVRVSYDLTGDGTFDRVETYRYFATDPVGGYERYTQAAGLASSSGALGNLRNGTVRVEVWNAIGNGASTLGVGNQSIVRLPLS